MEYTTNVTVNATIFIFFILYSYFQGILISVSSLLLPTILIIRGCPTSTFIAPEAKIVTPKRCLDLNQSEMIDFFII